LVLLVFSSQLFLFSFLPFILGLYYLVPKKGRHLVLTIVSYLFYGWANPAFMVLMLFSTLVDYICGLVISGQLLVFGPSRRDSDETTFQRRRKRALLISIITNLSLLGFFKYFNFGVENYDAITRLIGLPGLSLDLAFRVTLPLGISFYTLQSMSYTIDVYRGHAAAITRFIDFACYVSMFPQLVAGPIIRFSEVADQLQNRSHTIEKFSRGVALFSIGMMKKIVVANPCGKIADLAFGTPGIGVLDSWYGVIAYAFQIYFDFSAYSDMAIGLGLMLGFVFPKNFDSPYLSKSITEFWRRWHISLSSWLRDYLYLPLGGNRKGKVRTYINLYLVMLLGGLWHGSSWNFVIWGGIHGSVLSLERAFGKDALYRRLPASMKIALTFFIVLISWVFFRARTISEALAYLGGMFAQTAPVTQARLAMELAYKPYSVLTFILAGLIIFFAPQTWDFTKKLDPIRCATVAASLWISIALLYTQSFNPFIYFIF
jgi:alginate O-acetyltransferase complex protein AlgI